MKTIGLIIPYFGVIPEFCKTAWLVTARANKTVDFHFFTDDKNADVLKSSNIFVHYLAWEDLTRIVQGCFDFNISLERPYKLCDYRPAFGIIFKDYIGSYDFWGYCDTDLLLGDIRSFWTEEILSSVERCQYNGHISIYRNNDKMNNLFRAPGDYPDLDYRYVYTTNDACYFDEYRGMYAKCLKNNITVFQTDRWKDPKEGVYRFIDNAGKQWAILWDNKKLYAVYKNGDKEEIMYAHFFRRRFNLVSPEKLDLIKTVKVSPELVMFNTPVNSFDYEKNDVLYPVKYFIYRIKRQFKNGYSIPKIIRKQKWTKDSDVYNAELAARFDK